MGLELYLELHPNVIVDVFICITIIIAILTISKVAISEDKKTKKEVKKDDNRGNKKRSTKANVHKSR
jgi:hypothetical protein